MDIARLALLLALPAASAFVPGAAQPLAKRPEAPREVHLSLLQPPAPPGFVWADDLADEAKTDAAAPTADPTAAPVSPSSVIVVPDSDAVAAVVWERVSAAAERAIASRGRFALAIPGGSVMKMLSGTAPSWASVTTLAYVNHKSVPLDDLAASTHAKASSLFLEAWQGVEVLTMGGSADAAAEAKAYEAALRALPEGRLPLTATGLPAFDMMLVGVGDDGHVGSLYPGREEVLDASGRWVLPVEMKVPGSISLALPVMAAAGELIVAACGVSEKAPQGKGAAMARALEGDDGPATFPAVGLRGAATWVLDNMAASKLSFEYAECFELQMSRGDCSPPS